MNINIHGRALVGFISNRDPPQRSRFVMAPFTPTLWHESRLDAQHGGVPRRFSRQHMLCQICKKEGGVPTAAWVSYCRFPSADLRVFSGRYICLCGWKLEHNCNSKRHKENHEQRTGQKNLQIMKHAASS